MERKEGESIQMEKESFLKRYGLLIATGLVVGAAAVLLTYFGNPANMGFCIACFLRDIAGALNFQRAGFDAEVGTGIVQYIRPEIIGLVLGSTVIAFLRKEFKPRGGSSPMIRFLVAVVVMIGALVFLGCPLRMVIRIGGGDLNAVVGLVGFVVGILVGILVLKRGFSLRRAYQQSMTEGLILPASMVGLLVLALAAPSFIISSTPEYRSTQARSSVAGCCSPPASRRTVFTIFRAALGENPVPRSSSTSSTTRPLSREAVSPLPMPSERLITTCPGSPPWKVKLSPDTVSPPLGWPATP